MALTYKYKCYIFLTRQHEHGSLWACFVRNTIFGKFRREGKLSKACDVSSFINTEK